MKSKPATKMRHVVAWMNKAEWDQVLDYLYSKDASLQNHALQRISAWKGRFGHSTPVAVDSTADLVRCQVLDSSGQLDSDDLVLLYGMALVRFVNLITERKQGRIAKPLRRLAGGMNIPEWIVNLRHDFTHRRLPSLKWCRKGCAFVLQWLQQEYWSRQLGSRLAEDWDSESEEEDDEKTWTQRREEELLARQREVENHKKARELLISYEKERFQMYEEWLKHSSLHGAWLEPSADLSWILKQIKLFATDSREILTDTMVQDGFLIPTQEQLESLDIDQTGCYDPLRPCVPRVFLQFWLPLLKSLNRVTFIRRVLEKLFAELSAEPDCHRSYYLSAWISEVVLCNSKSAFKVKKKSQMMELFVNRMQLGWQQLLTACLNSPCAATPYLLQLLLKDMDEPPPPDTQEKLLRLCSIYTQGEYHDDETRSHADPSKPVYTLQNLKERLRRNSNSTHGLGPSLSNHSASSAQSLPSEDLQEKLSASVLEERQMALRGSPWQVCTDKVPWKFYPLGKVPGQLEDPSCLMVETYSTLTVFDQQVELDKAPQHHINPSIHSQNRTGSDGQLWSLAELNKLKSGLKLF